MTPYSTSFGLLDQALQWNRRGARSDRRTKFWHFRGQTDKGHSVMHLFYRIDRDSLGATAPGINRPRRCELESFARQRRGIRSAPDDLRQIGGKADLVFMLTARAGPGRSTPIGSGKLFSASNDPTEFTLISV